MNFELQLICTTNVDLVAEYIFNLCPLGEDYSLIYHYEIITRYICLQLQESWEIRKWLIPNTRETVTVQ